MIDDETINRLVYGRFERTDLDYKKDIAWDKETKYSLIKDVMAFANAGGGYIVVGWDEQQDEESKRRTGVTPGNMDTWDATKVCKDINNFCGPGLDVDVIRHEDDVESKRYVILCIPSHGDTPHLCIKEKHDSKQQLVLRLGALYFRSKNKECKEISDPHDYRELIARCLRARKEELLRDFKDILSGQSFAPVRSTRKDPLAEMDKHAKLAEKYKPNGIEGLVFREIVCFLDGSWTFDSDKVKNALSVACVDYRGWPFVFYLPNGKVPPQFANDMIFACDNEQWEGRIKFDYWSFSYDGAFYASNLTDESMKNKPEMLDAVLQVKLVGEAVTALGRIYSSLGLPLDTELEIAVRYSPFTGVRVGSVSDYASRGYNSPQFAGDSLSHRFTGRLSELCNSCAAVSANIVMLLLAKMGYDGHIKKVYLEKMVSEHLSKGRHINP